MTQFYQRGAISSVLILAFGLTILVGSALPSQAIPESEEPKHLRQTGEAPQPGDVYTMENIEELYPYTAKLFPKMIDTWREEHSDLRIEIRKSSDAEFPPSYVQATKDHADKVSITNDGKVSGYYAGLPFPNKKAIGEKFNTLDQAIKNGNPAAGWMILYNMKYHARPNASTGTYNTILADRHGNKRYRGFRTRNGIPNHRTMRYPDGEVNPNKPFDFSYKYAPIILFPSSVKDITQLLLIPDSAYDFTASMKVYSYLPSLRRVIPQSGVGSAHCAPTGGTDYYVDDNFSFAGVPSWFNVKYVGDKKLVVPFDPRQDGFNKMKIRPLSNFRKNYTNGALPKRTRYEVREHYVIELTPTDAHSNYCYPLKRLYVDKEVFYANSMENYDSNMKPWKLLINTAGQAPWTPEQSEPGGAGLNGPTYYDNAGYQLMWDVQAKHGTWSPNVSQLHSTTGHSNSDLTPTGLLKVIK